MPNTNEDWEHCGKPLHEFKLTRLPRGNKDSHQEFKVDVQAHQRGKTGPKNTDAEKIKEIVTFMKTMRKPKIVRGDVLAQPCSRQRLTFTRSYFVLLARGAVREADDLKCHWHATEMPLKCH